MLDKVDFINIYLHLHCLHFVLLHLFAKYTPARQTYTNACPHKSVKPLNLKIQKTTVNGFSDGVCCDNKIMEILGKMVQKLGIPKMQVNLVPHSSFCFQRVILLHVPFFRLESNGSHVGVLIFFFVF